jgi:GNAT superfamily N-acetyltransferase
VPEEIDLLVPPEVADGGEEGSGIPDEGRLDPQARADFSAGSEAEIVTFGVVADAIGTGAARHLMEQTLTGAFRPGISRVWLHTCTFDHPSAIRFYLRSGFRAWKYAIEVSDDPRRAGFLPRTAAPHVPLIEP